MLGTVASTFSVDRSTIVRETVAEDVEGWDSLGHTVLMIRLGRALGQDVPEHIASGAANVGQLVDLLIQRLGQPA